MEAPENTFDGLTKAEDSRLSAAAIIRIKNLELRARIVVEGFLAGLHRSPYHGFSAEFTDYRPYSPGDDLRYLDWKLFARRDRYYIKRFEEETNLRCYVLLDLSRSMGFGSLEYSKSDYAKTLAATFAYFLNRQRDAVGVVTFSDQIHELIAPRYRTGHLRRLMIALDHSTTGKSTDLSSPLEQLARTVTKRGMVVLISDLLVPVAQIQNQLGYLRSQGHDVMIVRTLDPREISFDFSNAALFRDLETGQEIFVDPQTTVREYQQRFQEHNTALKRVCDQLGVDYFSLSTDQALDRGLFDLIQVRKQRGRSVPQTAQNRTRGGR